MAGKRGRPRKYLKKGIPHKIDYDMAIKGYYTNMEDKKTNFLYPVVNGEAVTKDTVLNLLERHKGIDAYDIITLSYSVITNISDRDTINKQAGIEE